MIRNALISGALLVSLAGIAAPAYAEESENCTSVPQASWLTEDAAKAKAMEAGYDVRDIKTEGSCYEIYALKDGARVQAVMDPSSGMIVGSEEGED